MQRTPRRSALGTLRAQRLSPGSRSACRPFHALTRGSTGVLDVPANHNDANAIHVLATSFPVIRRMVGEQSFRLMAQRFIMSNPPRFPIALSYGESFPSFLRTQCRVASIEYVADIAELEVARRKAQQAADARPINASVSRVWQAEHPNGVRVILHPSLHVVASRFPIVTIWENNRRG